MSWVLVNGLQRVGQSRIGQCGRPAAGRQVGVVAESGAQDVDQQRLQQCGHERVDSGIAHVLAGDGGKVVEQAREISGPGVQFVFDAVGGPGVADIAQAAETAGYVIVYSFLDPRPILFPRNWSLRMYGFNVEHIATDPVIMGRAAQFLNAGVRSGGVGSHPALPGGRLNDAVHGRCG